MGGFFVVVGFLFICLLGFVCLFLMELLFCLVIWISLLKFVWKAAMAVLVLQVTLKEDLEILEYMFADAMREAVFWVGLFPHPVSAVDNFRCVRAKLQDTEAF